MSLSQLGIEERCIGKWEEALKVQLLCKVSVLDLDCTNNL